MIEEFYDAKNKDDYFAMRYIKKNIYKDGKFISSEYDEQSDTTFIRMTKKGEKGVNDFATDETGENDKVENFIYIPTFNTNKNDRILNVGSSGSRKSSNLNLFAKMYKMFHPQNRMFYFTMNSAEKDPQIMQLKENYELKVVNMKVFIDYLNEIKDDVNEIKNMASDFANSLLMFDDLSGLDGKNKRLFFKIVICNGLENFRKHGSSIYLILHSSRYIEPLIKEECTLYIISGNSMASKNDVVLKSVFKLKPQKIDELYELEGVWRAIDTHRSVVISENKVYKL